MKENTYIKKVDMVVEKLLDRTIKGTIKWKRTNEIFSWTYNYRQPRWEWKTGNGSFIHLHSFQTKGKVDEIVYLDMFNDRSIKIIENEYLMTDNSNVIKLYKHIQKEYDKIGAEIIDKLLEELNNL